MQRDEDMMELEAPELTMQTTVGEVGIAFVHRFYGDSSPKAISEIMDRYSRLINRQRSKFDITYALIDLAAARQTVAEAESKASDYRYERTEERVALVARWQAEWEGSHRAEFKLSVSQRQNLAAFDKATEDKLAKDKADCELARKNIPIYEAKVARHKAIIEGSDRADEMEMVPYIREAAE